MTQISTTGKATSMADLMKSVSSTFKTFHKGDIVEGRITKLTPQEVLVDVGAKAEAVVLERDKKILRTILSTLKEGDTVSVQILNPESDMGHPVISLRRFLDERLWSKLSNSQKNRELINVSVIEVTRGGYLVETSSGVSGFLPNSHTLTSGGAISVSSSLPVYILELDRPTHKVIFSQKPILTSEEFSKLTSTIKEGDSVSATVSNVTSFGVFVSVSISVDKNVDGLIHISEVSWDDISTLEGMFVPGQKIECKVIGKDAEAKRLDLSLKQMHVDPYEQIFDSVNIDQKLSGTVSKITSQGVVIVLDGLSKDDVVVEGIIRSDKIPVGASFEEGKKVDVIINQVDKKKRKILLVPALKEKPIGYR